MKRIRKIVCIFLLGILLTVNFNAVKGAKEIPYQPSSQFYINDFADVLDSGTENDIFHLAKNIEEKTTAQLVIVTVPSLEGTAIEEYANALFNQWKIGSSDKNNGVLLLISSGDRKIRLEIGYGLEGAINDAKAGRILDDTAIPYLKDNNYNQAVKDTAIQLEGIIYKEYGVEGGFDNYPEDNSQTIITIVVLAIIFFFSIIFLISAKNGKNFYVSGGPPFGGGSYGGGGRRWLFWRWRFFWRRRRFTRFLGSRKKYFKGKGAPSVRRKRSTFGGAFFTYYFFVTRCFFL